MSRKKYCPGVQLRSFFELFAHERMHNRRHGKPGLYYFGSDTVRPKPFAFIYSMQIRTIDHAMQTGHLRVAERIWQEAEQRLTIMSPAEFSKALDAAGSQNNQEDTDGKES